MDAPLKMAARVGFLMAFLSTVFAAGLSLTSRGAVLPDQAPTLDQSQAQSTAAVGAPFLPLDREPARASLYSHYTFALFPPNSSDPSTPVGIGFGRATIHPDGRVKFSGVLPTGETFSAGGVATLSDGVFTFSLSATLRHGKRGALHGVLRSGYGSFGSVIQGTLHWTRPALHPPSIHPAAIDADLTAVCAIYEKPPYGKLPMTDQVGFVDRIIEYATPQKSVTEQVSLCPQPPLRNAIAHNSKPQLASKLFFDPATGLISGSLSAASRVHYRGVVLGPFGYSFGFFRDQGLIGSVVIRPVSE